MLIDESGGPWQPGWVCPLVPTYDALCHPYFVCSTGMPVIEVWRSKQVGYAGRETLSCASAVAWHGSDTRAPTGAVHC